MPAIITPVHSPADSSLQHADNVDPATLNNLLRRTFDLVPRKSDGNYAKPSSMKAGVLVIFCLIGASLALLVWWLFVKRTGFIWRSSDWQDYKASVLRRPEERPDDAITVFSDGTARKGGGSSVGTRTVVLGELDTTYTKSYVTNEKPWGPRDPPRRDGRRKKGLVGSVWGKVEDSVWGKLRGGEHSEADTVVQREKELRQSRHRRRSTRRRHDRHHHRNRGNEDESDITAAVPFVDYERPAPPLTDITRSETSIRAPTRAPTKKGKIAITREPSYAIGDDRGAHYHRHHRTESAQSEDYSSSSSDYTSSDSDSSSDDDSELDQSQLGMAKGNKVYHHPISQDRVFWGNARPVERNGGGAGGTYGGGAPAVMPRGYRAGSVGSLSSAGSVRSSNAGNNLTTKK